jgi:hypothetical protein
MIRRCDHLSRTDYVIGEVESGIAERFDTARSLTPLFGAGSAEGLNPESE